MTSLETCLLDPASSHSTPIVRDSDFVFTSSVTCTTPFFGHLAGRHWSYIGSIERGERNVSFLTILALAKLLDVDPASLVTMDVSKVGNAVLEMRRRNKPEGKARRRGRPLGYSPRSK